MTTLTAKDSQESESNKIYTHNEFRIPPDGSAIISSEDRPSHLPPMNSTIGLLSRPPAIKLPDSDNSLYSVHTFSSPQTHRYPECYGKRALDISESEDIGSTSVDIHDAKIDSDLLNGRKGKWKENDSDNTRGGPTGHTAIEGREGGVTPSGGTEEVPSDIRNNTEVIDMRYDEPKPGWGTRVMSQIQRLVVGEKEREKRGSITSRSSDVDTMRRNARSHSRAQSVNLNAKSNRLSLSQHNIEKLTRKSSLSYLDNSNKTKNNNYSHHHSRSINGSFRGSIKSNKETEITKFNTNDYPNSGDHINRTRVAKPLAAQSTKYAALKSTPSGSSTDIDYISRIGEAHTQGPTTLGRNLSENGDTARGGDGLWGTDITEADNTLKLANGTGSMDSVSGRDSVGVQSSVARHGPEKKVPCTKIRVAANRTPAVCVDQHSSDSAIEGDTESKRGSDPKPKSLDPIMWRLQLLDQFKKRDSTEMDRFLDLIDKNPHVLDEKENDESFGLRGNLLELQNRFKRYSRTHHRRLVTLLVFIVVLIILIVAMGAVLGFTMGHPKSSGNDCRKNVYLITTQQQYQNLLSDDCRRAKQIAFMGFTPTSGEIALPTLTQIDDTLSLVAVGTTNTSVVVSLPNLIFANTLTVSGTHINQLSFPVLSKVGSSLSFEMNYKLDDIRLPSLLSVGEFKLHDMRLAVFSAPALTEASSIYIHQSDLGLTDLRALSVAPPIRISNTGGWSAEGPINANFGAIMVDYNNTNTTKLPSVANVAGGRIPDFACIIDERCAGTGDRNEKTSIIGEGTGFNGQQMIYSNGHESNGAPIFHIPPSLMPDGSKPTRPPILPGQSRRPRPGAIPSPPSLDTGDQDARGGSGVPNNQVELTGTPTDQKIESRRGVHSGIRRRALGERRVYDVAVDMAVDDDKLSVKGFKMHDKRYGKAVEMRVGPKTIDGHVRAITEGLRNNRQQLAVIQEQQRLQIRLQTERQAQVQERERGYTQGIAQPIQHPRQVAEHEYEHGRTTAFSHDPQTEQHNHHQPQPQPHGRYEQRRRRQAVTDEEGTHDDTTHTEQETLGQVYNVDGSDGVSTALMWIDFYLIAMELKTIDSFTASGVNNLTQLRFPSLQQIREFSVQMTEFASDDPLKWNVYMPSLRSATLINFYQTNNLGSLALVALQTVDYLTLEFCSGAGNFVFGSNATVVGGEDTFVIQARAERSGIIIGQSYSVRITMNRGMEEMKLLYLQTVLQGFDVDYNPQLTLLEMPELTTAVRVSIRHNPLLTGPLYFDKLTDASILIDGNEKLEGGLDFPVLTTCIVLLVHSCPVTSVSANSLALMTESSMEYNRVSLMLEYVLLQSDTTSNSLISIKDTMVTQVAFHSLLSGSDIILEGNKLLDQLQFTQLVSLTGQLTVGDCNHSTLYLPALYYASNITVLRNVHIENITFPELAALKSLTVVGNPKLTNLYLPKLTFFEGESYDVIVIMNDNLCLDESMFDGFTNGSCVVANQEIYNSIIIDTLLPSNSTFAPDCGGVCCDMSIVSNITNICELGDTDNLKQ